MSSIRTFSGNTFDYANPSVLSISIEDIAHSLSNICRFSGHVKEFYSVAEHSIRVSELCSEENKLWALLHDASEAYCSDLPRPFKRMIGMEPYRTYEKRTMGIICERFGLPKEEPVEVKQADMRMLVTEQRDLMVNAGPEWHDVEPLPHTIIPLNPEQARQRFRAAFTHLTMFKPYGALAQK